MCSKTYISLHVKYPSFLSDLNEISIFLDKFWKNVQISTLMIIRPVGAEMFRADRRTERHDTAYSRFFRNFGERT
jgi:hypothetical protein